MDKICVRCEKLQPIENFNFRKDRNNYWGHCKECTKFESKIYREKLGDLHRERARKYYYKNRKHCIKRNERWRKANPERVGLNKKIWMRKQRRNNPTYRINSAISNGIWYAMNINGDQRKNRRKWENIVGYSLKDLIEHIEVLFVDGMSLDNFGEWHIDHIKPKNSFDFSNANSTIEALRECWALDNLQPLWAIDNLKKGARHG